MAPDVLVAPVMEAGMRERAVYLPAGETWRNAWTGDVFSGGQTVTVQAPLDEIPIFVRGWAELPIKG